MARARKPSAEPSAEPPVGPSPAAPAQPAPTSSDPIDLAMAAQARDPGPDSVVHRVLVRQEQLIGWQIAGQRAGFILKGLTAIAGLLVAIAVGWSIWDASRYQGLVVQAFSVPPDLAARGLTGEAVAGDLLDDLVRMQSQTESVRAAGSYAIDWGDKVEVQIPQTGVSIGDLQRVLREQLGRETRISGVVYRLPDGQLSVTARTGGAAGETFVGPETEFDALILKAAESVYGQTQPYRYSAYLVSTGRTDEAIKVFSSFRGRRDSEAAWALRGWAYIDLESGRYAEARSKLLKALEIEPEMAALYYTLHQAESGLGHSEATLAAVRRAKRLFRSGRSQEVTPEGVQTMLHIMSLAELGLLGDYRGLLALKPPPMGVGLSERGVLLARAMAWAAAHEPEKVDYLLSQAPPWNDEDPSHRLDDGRRHYAVAANRAAVGDWVGAAAAYQAAMTAVEAAAGPDVARRFAATPLAVALARSGRIDEARALLEPRRLDCDACLVALAVVEAQAGRRAEADRLFARAVAQAPSIPAAYHAWGEAKLAQGDAAGALALFRQARERGPRWADPAKGEADALLALGRAKDAAAAYAHAARMAPRWGRLHLDWGDAQARAGQRGKARETWRLAAGMLLSSEDRRSLEGRLRQTPVNP